LAENEALHVFQGPKRQNLIQPIEKYELMSIISATAWPSCGAQTHRLALASWSTATGRA
jgi:hypothetical protein